MIDLAIFAHVVLKCLVHFQLIFQAFSWVNCFSYIKKKNQKNPKTKQNKKNLCSHNGLIHDHSPIKMDIIFFIVKIFLFLLCLIIFKKRGKKRIELIAFVGKVSIKQVPFSSFILSFYQTSYPSLVEEVT